MILIICTLDDVHVKHVLPKLSTGNYFVLYTDLFLSRYRYTSTATNTIIFDRKTGKSCDTNDIHVVWHRRTVFRAKHSQSNKTGQLVAVREAEAFLAFLKSFLSDKLWFSGQSSLDDIAGSKLNQINVVNALDFKTPKTIFSNTKKEIVNFFKGIDRIVIKSIAPNFLARREKKESDIFFYTSLITSEELKKMPFSRVNATVNFLQEYIEKKYELRITVVGKEVFACKISAGHLPPDKGAVDFRQGYGSWPTIRTLRTLQIAKCVLYKVS